MVVMLSIISFKDPSIPHKKNDPIKEHKSSGKTQNYYIKFVLAFTFHVRNKGQIQTQCRFVYLHKIEETPQRIMCLILYKLTSAQCLIMVNYYPCVSS